MQDNDCGERDESLGRVMLDRRSLAPDVRELSRIDNWKAAFAIARQWAVIALAVTAAVWLKTVPAYVLAAVVIVTRQHALGILMHDGTHFRLFSNRKANRILADLFCAFPVGLSTSYYAHQHLDHHRYLNSERDPYWIFW